MVNFVHTFNKIFDIEFVLQASANRESLQNQLLFCEKKNVIREILHAQQQGLKM